MTLTKVRKFVLSLAEVTEEPHFNRTSFRRGGRIFATALPDGKILNVMLGEAIREPALAIYSDCMEKLFWGKKVMGLQIVLDKASGLVVEELLRKAWEEKAPGPARRPGGKPR